jgi:hypothetical protein
VDGRPPRSRRRRLTATLLLAAGSLAALAATVPAAAGSTVHTITYTTVDDVSPNPLALPAGGALDFHNASATSVTVESTTPNWTLKVALAAGATSTSVVLAGAGTYGYQVLPPLAGPPTATGTIKVSAPSASPSPSPTASQTPTAAATGSAPPSSAGSTGASGGSSRPGPGHPRATSAPGPGAAVVAAGSVPPDLAPVLPLGFGAPPAGPGAVATPAPSPLVGAASGPSLPAVSAPAGAPSPGSSAPGLVAGLGSPPMPDRGLGLAEVIAGVLAAGVLAGWLRTVGGRRVLASLVR